VSEAALGWEDMPRRKRLSFAVRGAFVPAFVARRLLVLYSLETDAGWDRESWFWQMVERWRGRRARRTESVASCGGSASYAHRDPSGRERQPRHPG